MSAKTYTTAQAAKLIGVSRQTLQAWIAAGQIDAPELIGAGKAKLRVWTARDIERVKKFKGTLRPGPKRGEA
ncbi:MAG TPA: helix-turn-helix domain-containing protein [Terriglobales bacterium]|nr:helix-turn-helix domain-containing protein [Terriglobales bacterium]